MTFSETEDAGLKLFAVFGDLTSSSGRWHVRVTVLAKSPHEASALAKSMINEDIGDDYSRHDLLIRQVSDLRTITSQIVDYDSLQMLED
jgi:hypothetical protein